MHTANSSDSQVHQLHSNYPLPAMNNQNAASVSSCCYLDCGNMYHCRRILYNQRSALTRYVYIKIIYFTHSCCSHFIWQDRDRTKHTFILAKYSHDQLLSKDVNFMESSGSCWFCSYMNIYGSFKHHLVRERDRSCYHMRRWQWYTTSYYPLRWEHFKAHRPTLLCLRRLEDL